MVESVETRAGSVGSAVEARVGELLNDYLDRRARGEPISEEVLLAEHPDVADILAQHLSLLRALAPSSNAIPELLAKRMLSPSSAPEYAAELGNYRITAVIGRGGMGIVLRAIEQPLHRPVALKILRPELAADRRALVRFAHEAKAAAALRHPNIVTVHACGECDGTNYLAMELIDGPSLADALARESPLLTEEIRRIFGELLQGLAAAHSAGLIHRDIKSSNILLDGPHRQVKIADFGLARITASNTRVTMLQSAIGTPQYMSPEQARGDENVDHCTDLYSAGVVLYEMLTGRVPFKGDSPSALIHAILSTEPPAPRTLRASADKHLSRLSMKLLAKRKEDRFVSTDEALAAFEQRRGFRLRWSPNSRRRVLVAIALALCGIGFSFMVQSMRRDSFVSKVRLGKLEDGRLPTTIEARYGDDVDWNRFYTFPDPQRTVVAAELVKLGPGYEPIVLAGVQSSTDHEALFAFDAKRRDVASRKPLWSEKVEMLYRWPDCQPPTEVVVSSILPFEYDRSPGQEVALVGGDRSEYPTYIAVFDPRTHEFLAKYWHVGQIKYLKAAPDFLGSDRPAIIAVGVNNKLDGFKQRVDGDPKPIAAFDIVPMLMVLDAKSMQGERLINVPGTSHRMPDIESVLPYSYAFLNAAAGDLDVSIDPETSGRSPPSQNPRDREMMNFLEPRIVRCPDNTGHPFCIEIVINRSNKEEERSSAQFTFDPELQEITFIPIGSETQGLTKEFWLEKFHRLGIRGQYVGPSDGP